MELQLKIMVPRRSRDSANAAAAASSELATIRGADRINFRGERSRKSRKRSTARKSKGTAFQSFPSRRLHALVQQSARQRRRRSPVNSLLPGHSLTERRERKRGGKKDEGRNGKGRSGKSRSERAKNGAQSCRSRGSDTFLEDDEDDGSGQSGMKKKRKKEKREKKRKKRGNKEAPGIGEGGWW